MTRATRGSNLDGATQGALKLIDGDNTTKWYASESPPRGPQRGPGPAYLVLKLASPAFVARYKLVTADDNPARDPAGWRFGIASDPAHPTEMESFHEWPRSPSSTASAAGSRPALGRRLRHVGLDQPAAAAGRPAADAAAAAGAAGEPSPPMPPPLPAMPSSAMAHQFKFTKLNGGPAGYDGIQLGEIVLLDMNGDSIPISSVTTRAADGWAPRSAQPEPGCFQPGRRRPEHEVVRRDVHRGEPAVDHHPHALGADAGQLLRAEARRATRTAEADEARPGVVGVFDGLRRRLHPRATTHNDVTPPEARGTKYDMTIYAVAPPPPPKPPGAPPGAPSPVASLIYPPLPPAPPRPDNAVA